MSQVMSFEALIAGLTAAIEANTAALNAKAGSADAADATTTKTATAGKGKTATKTKTTEKTGPVHSKAEATAAVVALKDATDAQTARDLLSSFGFDKLANITEDKFDEVYDAATKALAELNSDDAGSDDDI